MWALHYREFVKCTEVTSNYVFGLSLSIHRGQLSRLWNKAQWKLSITTTTTTIILKSNIYPIYQSGGAIDEFIF